ncbi:MAG: MoaD/ThiS family protein [Candidatus Eremiobacteraeota bacterium]|nr:MoaD/ThiS family protein [Candidatus Eremiobacteraeota bacterium]
MTVRILAFARLRELLGAHEFVEDIASGSSVDAVWELLEARVPALRALRPATRFAKNGRIVAGTERIAEGDELALLPPVGGG